MEITRGHLQPGAFHGAAETEQRHDDAETELAIEIGAADAHAVIGENIGRAIGLAVMPGPEPHDRKIRRATADIGDQCDLLSRDLALIIQRRGDRLELEGDLIEADLACDLAQRLLRPAVGVIIIVDEMHRPAMHHIAQLATGGLFGAPFHRAQVIADHVAKPGPLAAEPGGLLDQRGAEHRFEAAHQAAGRALDIGCDRLAADQHRAVHLVEDRAGDRGLAFFQRRQHRRVAFNGAERRVRRSEIKSADRHERSRGSVRLHNNTPSIHHHLVAPCARDVVVQAKSLGK